MIIDSSVWLEIFSKGPLSMKCEKFLKSQIPRIPTLVLFEVYKKIKQKVSEDSALVAISYISQFEIIDLKREISLLAADISIEHKLGMADSIVLATAQHLGVELLTLDNDFSKLPNTVVLRENKEL